MNYFPSRLWVEITCSKSWWQKWKMFAVDSLRSETGSRLKVSKKILGSSENRVKDGVDGVGAQSLSRVRLFATPWTVAHQAPLSTGFSRQGCWSGLPYPPPGDLPDPKIKSTSLTSPALAGRFFTTSTTWEALRSGGTAAIHRNDFICFKQTQISDRRVLTQLFKRMKH